MNFSEKHKVVWLAPERCATKLICEIFKNYDFSVYFSEKTETKSLLDSYHSHSMYIPKDYNDYEVICSMRNPYDRVLSVFVNLTRLGNDTVFTKKTKNNFQIRFESFLNEIFELPYVKNLENNLERFPVFNTYITKLRFENKIPNKFIRMENLKEDLNDLKFLKNSTRWASGEFEDLIRKNRFINRRAYSFDEVYTIDSAKKVYDFYQNIFYLCDYDPFSFTKEKLSDEMKKNFLHGII